MVAQQQDMDLAWRCREPSGELRSQVVCVTTAELRVSVALQKICACRGLFLVSASRSPAARCAVAGVFGAQPVGQVLPYSTPQYADACSSGRFLRADL